MATQKSNKPAKGAGNLDWGNPVRSGVDVGRDLPNKDESHIPWVIVVCLAVMALTFVIAIPLLGMAYLDMHNATEAAIQEIRKMRELRARIILENQNRSE